MRLLILICIAGAASLFFSSGIGDQLTLDGL